MESILNFGKHKGETLTACEPSYVRWLAARPMVLAERNRWASRAASKFLEKKEETMDYQVNQYIEKNGQIGQVLHVYAYAYKVRIGECQSATWSKSDALVVSSKEAYNAQVVGDKAALQAAKTALRQKQRQATYRWFCLECGTKYNGNRCTCCDSSERTHNTDADTDMSILAEVGKSGPYAPKDEMA